MDKLNILFLGGAKRVSIAERFIKEGTRCNVAVRIFSYEIQEEVPISCIGKVIIGLKWNDKNIFNHLIEVVKKNSINIILPFVDRAIEICSVLKQQIGNVVTIPVSSEAVCKTMYEKRKAAIWFEKNRLPVPKTYDIYNIGYPAIFKPNTGSAAKGIIIVKNEIDLHKIQDPDHYLIQEFIEDNIEYTVDAYVSKNKEVITAVPRIRLETVGGEVIKSITINDDNIIKLSNRILKCDDFFGPITIQFIRNRINDELYIMEINPRLGGGVILSIEAGANIPEMIIKEHLGLKLEEKYNWKSCVLMTRYFKEVFYANNN